MKKSFVSGLLLFMTTLSLFSQNSVDALRYSRFDYTGSARFTAMGGSFGALGGEISSIMINPASVGIYRNSEFTFSTSILTNQTETNYRGNQRTDERFNFNIPNIGFVSSYKGNANGWKNYSFSIQYNRLNSFHQDSRLLGNSQNSSVINDYVDILNRNNASVNDVENFAFPFGPSEAWDLIMIDTLTENNQLSYVPFFFLQDNIQQRRKVESRGSQSETSFAFGGNYQDKLYLGASINIQRMRFEQITEYEETYSYNPPAQTNEFLPKYYNETKELNTVGTGVNFKIGAIYRFSDLVRLGASIHSPTFFGFSEEYSFDANSRFSDESNFISDGVTSNYRYRLRTPTRYSTSLAFILLQKASINLDYEYVDFSTAKLDDVRNFSYDFSESNREINNILEGSHNFRLGGEYNFSPFTVRLGYRYEGNPYAENLLFNPDGTRNTYSIGGGYRTGNFNFDLAYSFSEMNETDVVHNTAEQAAYNYLKQNNIIVSVGWKW